MAEINSHRDLVVRQQAMGLAVDVYQVTRGWPKDESYGLTAQARRAAVSVPANIAEGYGRESRGSYVRIALLPYCLIAEFFLEQRFQFAALKHFADDVAAADEFAFDVELRDGRPVGEFLHALADFLIGQHVHVVIRDAHVVEDANDHVGEPALGLLGGAFHEQHDRMFAHGLADLVLDI
jgi:hypothetical protein